MEFNITKMVEEIAMQAKENQEEFIFETIQPYCENILQMKINKEELKQILLNSIQKPQQKMGRWIKIPLMWCHYPSIGCVKNKKCVNDEWCSSCEFWRAEDFDYKCSKCGKTYSEVENFCPNCGANMREIPEQTFGCAED